MPLGEYKPLTPYGSELAQLHSIQAQTARQEQETQQQAQKLQQSQSLQKLKLQGLKDPKAAAIAAQLDPEYGKQLQEYQAKKTVYWGSQARAAAQLPISMRNAAYANIYKQMQSAGENVSMFPVPDDTWSDAKQAALEYGAQAAIEPAKFLDLQHQNQQLQFNARGGVQGALADRYGKDKDFAANLANVQTIRQGLERDQDGNVIVTPGYDDSKSQIKKEEARGTAKGTEVGKKEGTLEGKSVTAPGVLELIKQAKEILKKASSGGIQNLETKTANIAGITTERGKADAALDLIAADLTLNVPRMEGPQSDKDTQLYRQAAGDVANRNLPRGVRLAALNRLEIINKKYIKGNNGDKSRLLPESNSSNQSGRLKFNPVTGEIE